MRMAPAQAGTRARVLPAPAAAALAALALLVAGCTAPPLPAPSAPALPEGAPAPAARAAAAPAPPPGLQGHAFPAWSDEGQGCPVPSPPARHRVAGHEVQVLHGCASVATGERLDRVLDPIAAGFEVPGEARALRLVFHLHGGEPVNLTLLDPDGAIHRHQAWGNATSDTFAVFEWPLGRAGAWTLEGRILVPTLQRGWTLTIQAEMPQP